MSQFQDLKKRLEEMQKEDLRISFLDSPQEHRVQVAQVFDSYFQIEYKDKKSEKGINLVEFVTFHSIRSFRA